MTNSCPSHHNSSSCSPLHVTMTVIEKPWSLTARSVVSFISFTTSYGQIWLRHFHLFYDRSSEFLELLFRNPHIFKCIYWYIRIDLLYDHVFTCISSVSRLCSSTILVSKIPHMVSQMNKFSPKERSSVVTSFLLPRVPLYLCSS